MEFVNLAIPCTIYYKVDVTLELDVRYYLIILGINAIVSDNDAVVVFVGIVANLTGSELSRA